MHSAHREPTGARGLSLNESDWNFLGRYPVEVDVPETDAAWKAVSAHSISVTLLYRPECSATLTINQSINHLFAHKNVRNTQIQRDK